MRLAPIGALTGALLDFSASMNYPTTGFTDGGSSPISPGTVLDAAPSDALDTGTNVPNWGMARVIFVLNSGAAVPNGTLVTIDKDFSITAAASTGNSGRPLAVALTNFAIGSTTRQGGWVMVAGIAPVTFSVAATAGALYLGTAGNGTPTAAAGKQVLNATTIIAAASAFTRTVSTINGSAIIQIPRANGLFRGLTVSGTGISGTVAAIDPSGTRFTLSGNATATGTVTATFTPTGYGIVSFNNPCVQSQIT